MLVGLPDRRVSFEVMFRVVDVLKTLRWELRKFLKYAAVTLCWELRKFSESAAVTLCWELKRFLEYAAVPYVGSSEKSWNLLQFLMLGAQKILRICCSSLFWELRKFLKYAAVLLMLGAQKVLRICCLPWDDSVVRKKCGKKKWRASIVTCFFFFFVLFFSFFPHTHLLSIFWTSRGHRCRLFPPPVLAFNFYGA